MSDNRFTGAAVLVTGAASGIGAAVALEFAREGARVAVIDRDEVNAARTAERIAESGGEATALAVDVRDSDAVAECVAACVDTLGGVDVLVNNAAVVRYGDVASLSRGDWDLQIETNLTGVYTMCHSVIPVMKASGGGAIVNLSSAQAVASQARVAAYAATKAAILSLTRTLAIDHAADGIRANCVMPGSVRTGMLRYAAEIFDADDPEGAMERWGKVHPIGRVIEPVEIARVVLFLASDDASAVTGSGWPVDGGLTARLSV